MLGIYSLNGNDTFSTEFAVGNTDDQKVNKDTFSNINCDTNMKQTNKKVAMTENNRVGVRPT